MLNIQKNPRRKKKFENKMSISGLYTRGINDYIASEEFQKFRYFSNQLKICHRTLDGIGINYSRKELRTVKGYIKVLESMPNFSNDFLEWTGEAKDDFLRLCEDRSCTLADRSDGLSGINIALKYNINEETYDKSFYIKTKTNKVKVLNLTQGGLLQKYSYSYISNKTLIFALKYIFFMKYPLNQDCIELSFRKHGLNATLYPKFKNPKSRDRMGCEDHFNNIKHKDWEIEDEILVQVSNLKRSLTPITRGYTSFDRFRKIYFGLFSKKLSSFDI